MSTTQPAQHTHAECEFCKELSEAGKSSKPPQLTSRGKIMLGVAGTFAAGMTALVMPFVMPGFRRFVLPYIPASDEQVAHVLKALRGRSGSLIDIGSGDGRITIAAAQKGFRAYGVELNRWLVVYSKWAAWRKGLGSQATFFKKDLWKTDLKDYRNVVIFGVETMMTNLEEKLAAEMPPDRAIIACRFPLPTWEPVLTIGEGIDAVWLYITPQSKLAASKERPPVSKNESESDSGSSVDGPQQQNVER